MPLLELVFLREYVLVHFGWIAQKGGRLAYGGDTSFN